MGKEGIPARTEVVVSTCAVQRQRRICLTCAWTERGLRPAHDSEQLARAAGMGKEGVPARTEAVGSFKVYEDFVE